MSLSDIKKYSIALTKIQAIGPYIAKKVLFDLLENNKTQKMLDVLQDINDGFYHCKICGAWDYQACSICNSDRASKALCIVEHNTEMWAIEDSRSYYGRYYVLGNGAYHFVERFEMIVHSINHMVSKFHIDEIIIGFRSTPESQIITHYIRENVQNVKFSRIGHGLPIGVSVESTDLNTLGMALKNRCSF